MFRWIFSANEYWQICRNLINWKIENYNLAEVNFRAFRITLDEVNDFPTN